MSTQDSMRRGTASRPRMTLSLILCAIAAGTAAGAVSAATPDEEVPRLVVHYRPDSLATDQGARLLYARLTHAAEQVCPAEFTGSRLVSTAVLRCREQAVARAVREIDNPRLAAVSANGSKRG